MKRRLHVITILILTASLLLTGCAGFSDWLADALYSASEEGELPETSETPGTITPVEEEPVGDILVTQAPDAATSEEPLITVVEEEAGADQDYESISKEGIEETAGNLKDSYAYGQLNEEEQKLYLEILTILSDMREEVAISSQSEAQIDKVFKCVMFDHPEIFYVQGYSMMKWSRGGMLSRITFSGTYSMSKDTRREKEMRANAAAEAIVKQIPQGTSEYDTVKFIYDYLVNHTEYDLASEDNQNILSVLLNGRSVCQGYAKTAQYLLNRCGVFCTIVEGLVEGTEPHAWNIVRIDGKYYNMDVTWGDASYSIRGVMGIGDRQYTGVNYDYLNVTDDMIRVTHTPNMVIPLPVCNSMDANYYVRQGIYLTEFDETKLASIFADAYARGDETAQVKCADAQVYQAYYQYLITDEHIFDHLQGGHNVKYLEMKEQMSILFYL